VLKPASEYGGHDVASIETEQAGGTDHRGRTPRRATSSSRSTCRCLRRCSRRSRTARADAAKRQHQSVRNRRARRDDHPDPTGRVINVSRGRRPAAERSAVTSGVCSPSRMVMRVYEREGTRHGTTA
jgi:hypothetical protein